MDIVCYLEKKIQESTAHEWDPMRPIKLELNYSDDTYTIRCFVKRRNGSWVSFYELSHNSLITREEADNFFAQTLSTFLEQHHTWPR